MAARQSRGELVGERGLAGLGPDAPVRGAEVVDTSGQTALDVPAGRVEGLADLPEGVLGSAEVGGDAHQQVELVAVLERVEAEDHALLLVGKPSVARPQPRSVPVGAEHQDLVARRRCDAVEVLGGRVGDLVEMDIVRVGVEHDDPQRRTQQELFEEQAE